MSESTFSSLRLGKMDLLFKQSGAGGENDNCIGLRLTKNMPGAALHRVYDRAHNVFFFFFLFISCIKELNMNGTFDRHHNKHNTSYSSNASSFKQFGYWFIDGLVCFQLFIVGLCDNLTFCASWVGQVRHANDLWSIKL